MDNPTATVVLPANNATLTGNQWLDCIPPAGYDGVQFYLYNPNTSGTLFVGDATSTEYGWVLDWNSAGAEDGEYGLYCTSGIATSPTVVIYVSN